MQGWTHIMLPRAYSGRSLGEQSSDSPTGKPTVLKGEKGAQEEDNDSDAGSESTYAATGFGTQTTGISSWGSSWVSEMRSPLSIKGHSRRELYHSNSSTIIQAPETIQESQRDEADTPTADADAQAGELPSVGSAQHGTGNCRPCAWLYKPQGCANGALCRHCHLCGEGEIKTRKKVKVMSLRQASAATKEASERENRAPNEAGADVVLSAATAPARVQHGENEGGDAAAVQPPPGLKEPDVVRGAAAELPSAGSALHGTGDCRPCAWFHKSGGCANGKDCRHCHLCPEGELKTRKKDKVVTLRRAHTAKELSTHSAIRAEDLSPMAALSPMSPLTSLSMESFHMGEVFVPSPPVFLPSVGSSLHGTGLCRPCAWFWKEQGCANGQTCFHCHLCPEGEIAHRKKMKLAVMRTAERSIKAAGVAKESRPVPSHQMKFPRAERSTNKIQAEAKDSDEDSTPPSPSISTDANGAPVTLDDMPMSVPLPESMEMASIGAALHFIGKCKPCAWYWKPQGCMNGKDCAHCHACPEGELQNRRKAKVAAMKTTESNIKVAAAIETSSRSPRLVRLAPALPC
eukprot:TRINITY_DN17739_c0_g1_i1.p1 TRINITY_DN17739_c0_g1~~TRINITY_DN17739_c0_g1_i1.p1  ORF type:complete len:574 (+),score=102.56 TRINITY_DN17739_c0_g1_i1:304-2025(+)